MGLVIKVEADKHCARINVFLNLNFMFFKFKKKIKLVLPKVVSSPVLTSSIISAQLQMLVAGLWIRIRIGSGFSDFVDSDPNWESGSGSRGKKMKKFQWENALFSYLNKKFTT
jgi:hypothetical protein